MNPAAFLVCDRERMVSMTKPGMKRQERMRSRVTLTKAISPSQGFGQEILMREIGTKEHFRLAMELQTLRLTVRLGSIVATGIVVLGAFLKLT